LLLCCLHSVSILSFLSFSSIPWNVTILLLFELCVFHNVH
jgi:hypothetical protein